MTNVITEMTSIYSKATVCPYKKSNCNDTERLTLDPDLNDRFMKSSDYDELKYLWKSWHDETGQKMREKYKLYVDLMDKIAIGNDFANAAIYWQDAFDDPHFEKTIENLWTQVKPLYDKLQSYMRYKLIEIYGKYSLKNQCDPNQANLCIV